MCGGIKGAGEVEALTAVGENLSRGAYLTVPSYGKGEQCVCAVAAPSLKYRYAAHCRRGVDEMGFIRVDVE